MSIVQERRRHLRTVVTGPLTYLPLKPRLRVRLKISGQVVHSSLLPNRRLWSGIFGCSSNHQSIRQLALLQRSSGQQSSVPMRVAHIWAWA